MSHNTNSVSLNADAVLCPLCVSTGGMLIYQHALFRVVSANEPLYPGFLRVVWNAHVREFSHLLREHRLLCIDVVCCLEQFMLDIFRAHKCNIATLGNVVPHLHWHVIPRFMNDAHFPESIWAEPKQNFLTVAQQNIIDTQKKWHEEIHAKLSALCGPCLYKNQASNERRTF